MRDLRAIVVWAAFGAAASGCTFDESGPAPSGGPADGAANVIDAPPNPGADAHPIDATPVGCQVVTDCATPPDPCSLAGTCDPGTHTCVFPARDCSAVGDACNDGICDPDSGACVPRPVTDGTSCGAGLACGDFSACAFEGNPYCDESGTQSRSCTDNTCQGGVCSLRAVSEQQPCVRETDGTSCMSTDCTPFVCAGFSSTCDESGTQTRTCTQHTCADSACAASTFMQTEPCNRDTDGVTCADPTCGSPTPCGAFANTCDETGTQSRSCTPNLCAGGSCSPSSPVTEFLSCTRNTDGTICSLSCEGFGCAFCCNDGSCPMSPPGGNCMSSGGGGGGPGGP